MKKNILITFMTIYTLYGMEQEVLKPQQKILSSSSSSLPTVSAQHEAALTVLPTIMNLERAPEQQNNTYRAWKPQAKKTKDDCSFCTITHDKEYLIIGDSDGRILIYLCANLKLVCVCDTAKETFPWHLATSSDNKYILFTYHNDNKVYIYNISNWNNCYLHKKLVGHTSRVKFAKVTENLVITWSTDGTIKLWDLKNANSSPISSVAEITGIHRLLLSSNCDYVFSCASGHDTQLWDISDPENLKLEPIITQECQTPVEIAKIGDNRYLVTRVGRNISLYSLEDGNPSELLTTFEHPSRVIAHLFLPDLNYLIVSTDKYAFYIWDLKELKKPQLLSVNEIDECEGAITAFAMYDNKFLFTGTYKGSIYVWDAKSPKQLELLKKFRAHSPCTTQDPYCHIKQLQILPNNTLLSFGQDGTVKFWSLPNNLVSY